MFSISEIINQETIEKSIGYGLFKEINEDGLLDDFDLTFFLEKAIRDLKIIEQEIDSYLILDLYYEKKVSEWIEVEILFNEAKYDCIKPKDLIFYNDKGDQINDENASQKTFISLMKEFIQDFYIQFYSYIKETWVNKMTELREVNEAKNENKKSVKIISQLPNKLVWTGTPAQFGFIINELIGKGYLEKPTASFAKDVKIYLEIFDINTTPATLEKEINLYSNSTSANNASLLKMTHIDKLK